ncbi:uncharacterized protein DMAD_03543 [Drosophila madeirensis]|uniref:Uncharacterized protein n=1 Tax=Drosophila madeirensis TaxID=30013 RepID=A0AAU9G9L2_DROMD
MAGMDLEQGQGHIQALEYLSDAQFDGQGHQESVTTHPGQWEKSQQAADKLRNCTRKISSSSSISSSISRSQQPGSKPANKWKAQQWDALPLPLPCPLSPAQAYFTLDLSSFSGGYRGLGYKGLWQQRQQQVL